MKGIKAWRSGIKGGPEGRKEKGLKKKKMRGDLGEWTRGEKMPHGGTTRLANWPQKCKKFSWLKGSFTAVAPSRWHPSGSGSCLPLGNWDPTLLQRGDRFSPQCPWHLGGQTGDARRPPPHPALREGTMVHLKVKSDSVTQVHLSVSVNLYTQYLYSNTFMWKHAGFSKRAELCSSFLILN